MKDGLAKIRDSSLRTVKILWMKNYCKLLVNTLIAFDCTLPLMQRVQMNDRYIRHVVFSEILHRDSAKVETIRNIKNKRNNDRLAKLISAVVG